YRRQVLGVQRPTLDTEGRAIHSEADEGVRGTDRAPCADPTRGEPIRPGVGELLRGSCAGENEGDPAGPCDLTRAVRGPGRALRRRRGVVHEPRGVARSSSALARVGRGQPGEQLGVAARELPPPATPPWGWERECRVPRGTFVKA